MIEHAQLTEFNESFTFINSTGGAAMRGDKMFMAPQFIVSGDEGTEVRVKVTSKPWNNQPVVPTRIFFYAADEAAPVTVGATMIVKTDFTSKPQTGACKIPASGFLAVIVTKTLEKDGHFDLELTAEAPVDLVYPENNVAPFDRIEEPSVTQAMHIEFMGTSDIGPFFNSPRPNWNVSPCFTVTTTSQTRVVFDVKRVTDKMCPISINIITKAAYEEYGKVSDRDNILKTPNVCAPNWHYRALLPEGEWVVVVNATQRRKEPEWDIVFTADTEVAVSDPSNGIKFE